MQLDTAQLILFYAIVILRRFILSGRPPWQYSSKTHAYSYQSTVQGLFYFCSSSPQGRLLVFFQSPDHDPVFVSIETDISIPARAESVIQGRVQRSSNCHLGMVCAMTETSASSCYTAYSISQVNERKIPDRNLNISNSTAELHAGEK